MTKGVSYADLLYAQAIIDRNRLAEIEREERREHMRAAAQAYGNPDPFRPRMRRSRVDWEAITGDPRLAMRQMAHERRLTALAMRRAGMTFDAIGARFAVTRSRAVQLVNRAEQLQQRAPWSLSPVEKWMRLSNLPLDLGPAATAQFANKMRHALSVITGAAGGTKRDWLYVATPRKRAA